MTMQARIGGSDYTVFKILGTIIPNCRQMSHTSPAPVGPGATPIQSLDAKRPSEIITPAAQGMGTLVLRMYELWGQKVWATAFASLKINAITQATDLVSLFDAFAANGPIQLDKYVVPPAGTGVSAYTESYIGCVIGNVVDGETIEIGTMEVFKDITIHYTNYGPGTAATPKP